jgi:4'-phosphopantetheinyl transferase
MITIYYCRLLRDENRALTDSLLEGIPPATLEKLGRFRCWQDYQAHLFGRILLRKALEELDHGADVLHRIRYSPNHRPYLENDSLDFNISHSGEWVVLALSDGPRVGVDIERIQPIHLHDFRNVFSGEEWDQICGADDRDGSFFDCWAKKEAVIKADGCGWMLDPSALRLRGSTARLGTTTWRLIPVNQFDGYAAWLATEPGAESEFRMEEIKPIIFL